MRRVCNLFFDKNLEESNILKILFPHIPPHMKVIPYLLAASTFFVASSAFAITMGDFKKVDCSLPVFTANGCAVSANTQCFDGGSLKAGEKITGLSDTWTNTLSGEVALYKDEITYPSVVNVGGTNSVWLSNPALETDFWKVGAEVVFTPDTTDSKKRDMFILKPSKKVTVLEASLGANYQLERSDKKNDDYVGIVKFPVNYHVIDDVTGKAGPLVNHLECAAFKLSAVTAGAVVPVEKPTPTTPAPAGATKVKTGAADTFLFMGLAMLLALAFMFARKRRSV